ncbi:MAG: hypothetical protein JNK25_04225 [Phycisphaerae bacterium]|nr:hypothetical protein [Phycisphaerae bacterium]
MKALWNATVAVAFANLLALSGFVIYLIATDRLDLDRARQVRLLLTVTITEQKAAEAEAASKAQADVKAAEEAAKAARPPLTAAEKLAARVEATELDRERASRLRREVESLQQRLAADARKLAEERAALETDKAAFTSAVREANARAGDEQFQKSLGILSGLKPGAAKAMLLQIIEGGGLAPPLITATTRASSNLATVIAYLDAMDERPRAKIMAEFAKDDPALATRLLESLRTSGQVAQGPAPVPGTAAR